MKLRKYGHEVPLHVPLANFTQTMKQDLRKALEELRERESEVMATTQILS